MRKTCGLIAAVLVVSLLAGCGGGQKPAAQAPAQQSGAPAQPAAPKTMTLRLGHEMQEDHPYHLGAVKFAELVNQKTNGAIKVVVYSNGQLGTAKTMNEMVATGQLDFDLTWSGVLEAYDKNLGMLILPYLFRDWDHVWKVMDGPVGEEIFKNVEAKGIKVLTCMFNGLDDFFSRIPVKSPKDIKGIKVRVQQSPILAETFAMLGGVVTPMSVNEVYSALQTGAVDGQVQAPLNMRKSKFYEVSKYAVETKFYYMVQPFCMNKKLYDSLPADQQKAIVEAAREAAVYQRKLAEQDEAKDVKFLKEECGMTWFQPNQEEWIAAMKPIYDKHPEWAALVKKIQDVK